MMNEKTTVKRKTLIGNRRVWIAAVVTLSLLLTAIGVTFAWFTNTVTAPGSVITTGKIALTFRSYKSLEDGSLARYLDADTAAGEAQTLTLAGGLDRYIGKDASEDGQATDDTYFVIEKQEGCIPLDIQLVFELVGLNADSTDISADGSVVYAGGYWYELREITDDVIISESAAAQMQNVSVCDMQLTPSYTTEASDLTERCLQAYINRQIAVEPTGNSLLTIGNGTNTSITLRSKNVCIYRLTCGVMNSDVVRYMGNTLKLNVTLCAAQVGGLSGYGNSTTYYVQNASELSDIVGSYLPNASIVLQNDIEYPADLVFTRPVNLYVRDGNQPHTLTVKGNLIFSYAYQGTFCVDTRFGGRINVEKQQNAGGNLEIDTPFSNFVMVGTNRNNSVLADICIENRFTVHASCPSVDSYPAETQDCGLVLSHVRICSGKGIQERYNTLKTLVLTGDTQLWIANDTVCGGIIADSVTQSGGTKSNVNRVVIVNHGDIINNSEMGGSAHIDLSNMNVKDANSYAQTYGIPQIYIDNYGSMYTRNNDGAQSPNITLPAFSTKFVAGETAEETLGNTRIIDQITGVTGGVTNINEAGFRTQDMEKPANYGQYVVDVSENGDGTALEVYYTDYRVDNSVLPDLEMMLTEFARKMPSGYTLKSVNSMTVYTFKDRVFNTNGNDFTYIRTHLEGLVSLNLADAVTAGDSIPARAFEGMSKLETLTLPIGTTSIGDYFVQNTKVYDLYLPVGVTSATEAMLKGVRYVHPQNTEVTMKNLCNATTNRYIFVSVPQLTDYRNAYTDFKKYIFTEASYDRDAEIFYRIVSNDSIELACYVGEAYPQPQNKIQFGEQPILDFRQITLSDRQTYQILRFDDYAFDGKIQAGDGTPLVNISFNTHLTKIGDFAFQNNPGIGSVQIIGTVEGGRAVSSCVIGTEAFHADTGLTTVKIADWTASVFGGNMLQGCSSLKSITVENTSKSDFLTGICRNVVSLKTVTLNDCSNDNFDNYCFAGCTALDSVQLNRCDALSLGDHCFEGCSGLVGILLLDGVTDAGEACFKECTGIQSVQSQTLTHVGVSCFANDTGLITVILPSLYDFSQENDYKALRTFSGCVSLSVAETAYPYLADKPTTNFNLPELFGGVLNMKTWIVHNENTPAEVSSVAMLTFSTNLSHIYGAFYPCQGWNKDTTSLRIVIADGLTTGRTYFGGAAVFNINVTCTGTDTAESIFWLDDTLNENVVRTAVGQAGDVTLSDLGCGDYLCYRDASGSAVLITSLLEQIGGTYTVPTDVATILPYGYRYTAFAAGTDVRMVGTLKKIGNYAFLNRAGIESVMFTQPCAVNVGTQAFAGCASLENVTFAQTGKVTIGNQAFKDTPSMNQVTFAENSGSVELDEQCFLQSGVETVVFAQNGFCKAGSQCFADNERLKTVRFENNGKVTLESKAFRACAALDTLVFDQTDIGTIGESCFENCTGLTGTLRLDNVTKIGNFGFRNCGGIETVTSDTVTEIGLSCFYNDGALVTVNMPKLYYFGQTTGYTSLNTFGGCTSLAVVETALPYMPDNLSSSSMMSQMFSGLLKTLKLWIVHTEDTPEAVKTSVSFYFNTTHFFSPFDGVSTEDLARHSFRIVMIENPGNTNPYIGGTAAYGIDVIHTVKNTGDRFLWSDCEADGLGNEVSRLTFADGQRLSDFGCGDYYIRVSGDGNAAMVTCLLETAEHTYTVPSLADTAYPVTAIGPYGFAHVKFSADSEIVIPEGVVTVGDRAFADGLFTAITLPTTLTDLGTETFLNCTALETIYIHADASATAPIAATSLFGKSKNQDLPGPDGLSVQVSDLQVLNTLYTQTWGGIPLNKFLIPLEQEGVAVYYLEVNGTNGYTIRSITVTDTGLETYTLPSLYDGKPILAVSDRAFSAFAVCRSVKTLVLPDGLSNVSGNDFSVLPKTLQTLTVSADNAYFKTDDGILYTKDGCTLLCCPAGKTLGAFTVSDAITSIGKSAFANRQPMTVQIPASRTAGLVIESGAFVNTKITLVYIQ